MDFETIERNANFNINTLISYTPFFIFYNNNSSNNNDSKIRKLVGIIDKQSIINKVDEYITKRKNKEGQRSHAIDLVPVLTIQSEVTVNRSFHFVKAVCEHFNITSKRVLFCNVFCYKTVSGKFCNFTNLFDLNIRKGNAQISLVDGDIPKRASTEDLRDLGYVVNQHLQTPTVNNSRLPIVAPTTDIIYISSDNDDKDDYEDNTSTSSTDSFALTVGRIVAKRLLGQTKKQKKTKIRKVRNTKKELKDDNSLMNSRAYSPNNDTNNNSHTTSTATASFINYSDIYEMTTPQLIYYLKDNSRLLRVDEEQFESLVTYLHKERVDGQVFLGLTTYKLITFAKFTLGLAEKVDTFIQKLNQQVL
ncbi:hypothetical protein ABK040_012175 [Willaertia magna]